MALFLCLLDRKAKNASCVTCITYNRGGRGYTKGNFKEGAGFMHTDIRTSGYFYFSFTRYYFTGKAYWSFAEKDV